MFEAMRFYKRGPKVIWAASAETEPGEQVKVEALGMALVRTRASWPKPTTAGCLAFGRHASRNIVDLSDDQMDAFLYREIIPFDAGDGADDGFVLVRNRGHVLGCGLYLGGRISSQLSKGRAFRRRDSA